MTQDFKFALRSLLQHPAFAATAILSLALGIGANTAIFTLTHQVLLRVLPVKDPQRLVSLTWTGQFIGGSTRGFLDSFSYPMYADLRDSSRAFTGLAAQFQSIVDLTDNGPAQRANAELVSGNYFDVLGVTAAIGRTLTPADDKLPGGEPYIVLSYDYWQKRFGGNPSVRNRSIDLNGHPMTILGVAEPGFQGSEMLSPADVFVPLAMKTVVTPTWDDMRRRNSIWLKLFARLKAGVSYAAAESSLAAPFHAALENDLAAVARDRKFSERYVKNRLRLVSASQGFGNMREFFSKPLYVLLAMVGTLLLIVCVNVANLFITRAAARQKEVAIRLALGAARASLIRLLMTESVLIALVSGALGLLLSGWIAALLVSLLPFDHVGEAIRTSPDLRILALTAGLSLLTALAAGLAPALEATRPSLAPSLKNESRAASLGVGQTRLRRVLVAGQIALSFLLLAAAGLFARSLYKVMTVDSGIDAAVC